MSTLIFLLMFIQLVELDNAHNKINTHLSEHETCYEREIDDKKRR